MNAIVKLLAPVLERAEKLNDQREKQAGYRERRKLQGAEFRKIFQPLSVPVKTSREIRNALCEILLCLTNEKGERVYRSRKQKADHPFRRATNDSFFHGR